MRTIDFAKYSSIKIGSVVDVALIRDKSFDPKGFFIIGGANNLLISNNPPPLAMLGKEFDFCHLEDDCVRVGGAFASGKLASFFKHHNLAGLEFLGALPGSVGGLVAMNAGMKEYEIFDELLWVDLGNGRIEADKIAHGYRFAELNGVVFEVGFKKRVGYRAELAEMFKNMRANQPKNPSAGSCFKNPESDYAGRLIEAVGMRGFVRNSVAFSDKHANFLVNLGGGVFDDALWLISEAQKRVSDQFGITLECEIKIL